MLYKYIVKFIVLLSYLIGLYCLLNFSLSNYQIKNYLNKDRYLLESHYFINSNNPELLLYAIKYEIFVNNSYDLIHLFSLIDKSSINYSTINFLKFYNSLVNFSDKRINIDKLILYLNNARKFHRYSPSVLHLSAQIYAQTMNLPLFSEVLLDYFYKNLKYSTGFILNRENLELIISKNNASGIGIDSKNKKIFIQLNETDANFFLFNAREAYSCDKANDYIMAGLSGTLKIFFSNTTDLKFQNQISSQITVTLSNLADLCQSRKFLF